MPPQRRALVVDDGSSLTGLATSRGLTAAGFFVGLCSPTSGLAARSRSVARLHATRLAAVDPDGFLTDVKAASNEYDVVVPTGDLELLTLSEHRAELGTLLLAPGHEQVLASLDKLALARACQQVGQPTPRTWAGDDPALSALAPDTPVVVKARLRRPGAPHVTTRVMRLSDRRGEECGEHAVVQEVCSGPLGAVVVATDTRGRLLGVAQQSADVVYPQPAGNLVRGRTVAVDDALVDRLLACAHELGWWGIAQFELVGDALVDLNGRPFGSLGLAQAAGVDPVVLAMQAAFGEATRPTRSARVGVTWSSLGRDLRAAFGARDGRGLALRAALAAASRSSHAAWSWHDPSPVARQLRALTRAASRRLSRQ